MKYAPIIIGGAFAMIEHTCEPKPVEQLKGIDPLDFCASAVLPFADENENLAKAVEKLIEECMSEEVCLVATVPTGSTEVECGSYEVEYNNIIAGVCAAAAPADDGEVEDPCVDYPSTMKGNVIAIIESNGAAGVTLSIPRSGLVDNCPTAVTPGLCKGGGFTETTYHCLPEELQCEDGVEDKAKCYEIEILGATKTSGASAIALGAAAILSILL